MVLCPRSPQKVQRRQRNVQKSVMRVQSSCFAEQIGLVEPVRIIKTITFMKLEINVSTFDPPEKEDSPTIAQRWFSGPFTDLCIKPANTSSNFELIRVNNFQENSSETMLILMINIFLLRFFP